MKKLYHFVRPPPYMASPMDAAWSVLKSDPRMQAFSLGLQPGSLRHPDLAHFPQTRMKNLGTVDPNVLSMALQQRENAGLFHPRWGNSPIRDFMVHDSEVPLSRQIMSTNTLPLHSERDYGGDGSGFISMVDNVADGVPNPMAISRAPRPYHGATFDVGRFSSRSGTTLAEPSSPQAIIDTYFNHFGRNPTTEEMAGLVPIATRPSQLPRHNINELFPNAMEAARSTNIGNPDNIQMLPEDFMQQV